MTEKKSTQNVSEVEFVNEVRYVMKEYEIEDLDEGVEETLTQYTERGIDVSGIDVSEAKRVLSTTITLPASMSVLAKTLTNHDEPIGKRMRSLFYLRSVGGPTAIAALVKTLLDTKNGSLLRHEAAFVLGQMTAKSALSSLETVLQDCEDDAMTRHECAEAIGAIGSSERLLKRFASDRSPEVAETCSLALDRIQWQKKERSNGNTEMSAFHSVDPAPPLRGIEVSKLRDILLNGEERLFRRYGALFALRNVASKDAVRTIATALDRDSTSALFRHEVAYVCGQLSDAVATDALCRALARDTESVMVRHEAAEALGAIGTEKCITMLKDFCNDKDRAVAESCVVALDSINYWEDEHGTGITKSEAAKVFAEPIRCSCAGRKILE